MKRGILGMGAFVACGAVAALLAGVGEPPKEFPKNGTLPAAPAAAASLYDRLGGADGIATVVDDFVPRLAADTRITKNKAVAESLARISVPGLKFKLTAQVCEVTGGPWMYAGKDMPTAHMTLGITEDEWNACVEDLLASLAKFGVPDAEQKELIAIVATTHDSIVAGAGAPKHHDK